MCFGSADWLTHRRMRTPPPDDDSLPDSYPHDGVDIYEDSGRHRLYVNYAAMA